MNPAQKIKELLERIRAEQSKIDACKHVFEKPFSNPETVREPSGFKLETHGSDSWSVPDGYHDVQKPRWTRVCTLCGKEEHTHTQKIVSTLKEPDFGGNS
jgi:hypothetical protein